MHGDAPRDTATLVAGLIISGLISNKGPVAALTVDVVSSMGVEVSISYMSGIDDGATVTLYVL